MFDIAWTEMLLLAAITILVVGPKDLPRVMRTVGGWVRKARELAREFQGSVEQLAREAELSELRKDAEALKGIDPNQAVKKAIDPTGELEAATRIDAPGTTSGTGGSKPSASGGTKKKSSGRAKATGVGKAAGAAKATKSAKVRKA